MEFHECCLKTGDTAWAIDCGSWECLKSLSKCSYEDFNKATIHTTTNSVVIKNNWNTAMVRVQATTARLRPLPASPEHGEQIITYDYCHQRSVLRVGIVESLTQPTKRVC